MIKPANVSQFHNLLDGVQWERRAAGAVGARAELTPRKSTRLSISNRDGAQCLYLSPTNDDLANAKIPQTCRVNLGIHLGQNAIVMVADPKGEWKLRQRRSQRKDGMPGNSYPCVHWPFGPKHALKGVTMDEPQFVLANVPPNMPGVLFFPIPVGMKLNWQP